MKTKKECNEYLKIIQKKLDELVDKKTGTINVTGLSRKEKEEITNTRNCLLVQEYMIKWFLEIEEK